MPELTYIIDKEQTESTSALVIQIVEKDLPKRPLTRSLLASLAIEKDRPALDFLTKEKLPTYNSVPVKFSQAIQALKLIAGTGKLYFNGKLIIPDFFSKVEFFFLLEAESENALCVQGMLKTQQQTFNIRTCDFVCAGPPHWFIQGVFLKFISTDVPWKVLKKAIHPTPWLLSKQEQAAFLEDCESDEEGPKVVFAKEQEHLRHQQLEPIPLLILKDRTGAFADLWMDYGDQHPLLFQDTAQGLFKRQFAVEKNWEKDLLETDFIKKEVGTSHYFCPLDKVAKSLAFLLEVGWKIVDSRGSRVVLQTDLQLTTETDSQHIAIKGKVKYDTFEADVSEVIGAFNRRERFVTLGSGKVGLLPDKWTQTAMETLVAEGEIVNDGVRVKRNRLGSLGDLWNQPCISIDTTLQDLKERLSDFKGIVQTLPGIQFKGELRPYQQAGVNWLAFLYDYGFHGLLADDMGLGKTVQVLAFLSQLNPEGPILIVLPTSLIFNWKSEIGKFLNESSLYIHHGPLRTQQLDVLKNSRIILTSYTTLRLDLPLLSQIDFQCVILDEAQTMKNAQTQIAQAIYALRSRFRLSITGTPIENHWGELWAHFRFLIPDLFGTEEMFAADVQAASSDSRYLERIKKKIRPFLLRRTKEEVLKDLPERIDQLVFVEMHPSQRQVYDDFLSGVRGNLLKKVALDGMSKHRLEVLEAILRLRQICCHPLLVESMLAEDSGRDSAKMEIVLQDLETAFEEGKKVLIYSQFTSMLQLLTKALKQRQWPYVYLDGSTENREEVVNQFQNDPQIPFFLISLKAGGVGLNLTAADYVFIYDPWWNEAAEEQAINRAHRIGRHATVFAKRYVVAESIEEKILKLKESKKTLIRSLLDEEGDGDRPPFKEEDFLFLLT